MDNTDTHQQAFTSLYDCYCKIHGKSFSRHNNHRRNENRNNWFNDDCKAEVARVLDRRRSMKLIRNENNVGKIDFFRKSNTLV